MSERSGIDRREAITALALGGAALVTGCATRTRPQATPATPAPETSPTPAGEITMSQISPAFTGAHQVVPLPFQPSSLDGISEKMIVSHHENNYGGAVRNLNRVEQELAKVTPETPPFVVGGLRQSELQFRNSKRLHEVYFANLGGNGRRSGPIEAALAAAYGSSARWEEHFRATGASLGGGSGWVILGLELDTGALRTVWSDNHTQHLSTCAPLLVMDMYEHSYQMDYGAAAARYIDAFFKNVQWEDVNRRLERARRAAAALHEAM
jgi:Fe-Mn family superoxide dismutase